LPFVQFPGLKPYKFNICPASEIWSSKAKCEVHRRKMTFNIENAREAATSLNRKLWPIAKRPVDISDPHWMTKLRDGQQPLDEAGIRVEAESLLAALLAAYAAGTPPERESIRELLRANAQFAWATSVQEPPTTPRGFRQHLLLLSANDEGQDSRDVILSLDDLLANATREGVDIAPIVAEIDAMSSEAFQRLLARYR
jgi:hypothetical protein